MLNLKTITSKIMATCKDLEDNKVAIAKMDALNTQQELPCTVTKGSAWGTVTGTAYYVGGGLVQIYFKADDRTTTTSGNITNELICSFSVDTKGLIKTPSSMCFCNSDYGTVTSMATYNNAISGNTWTFDIYMAAILANRTTVSGIFYVPCELFLEAF